MILRRLLCFILGHDMRIDVWGAGSDGLPRTRSYCLRCWKEKKS